MTTRQPEKASSTPKGASDRPFVLQWLGRVWVLGLRLGLVLVCNSILAATAFEALEFESVAQEQTYKSLIDEVRCPRCQNVNLAGSDAPIAKDLRATIYRLLREGRSEAEILSFLQARYGDFVLYDPPLKPSTYVLWFAPVVLFVLGMIVLVRVARRQSRPDSRTHPLAPDEQQQLDALLAQERHAQAPAQTNATEPRG